jgi:predicted methyltransferase
VSPEELRHRNPRLTDVAQQRVREVLRPGSMAIDATMGNGHDTLFLARAVSPGGRVMAFDVQETAVENTRQRLLEARLDGVVTLWRTGHEHLAEHIPATDHGQVDAVMFNLGYLPGSDKTVVTRADTTCQALSAATEILAPCGILSVLLYRDHAEAATEAVAVQRWLAALPEHWSVEQHDSAGPVLYLVKHAR